MRIIMKLSDKRKRQIIRESFEQDEDKREDYKAFLNRGIDHDYDFFDRLSDEEERAKEDYKNSLLTHAGQDDDGDVIDIDVSANDTAEDMEKRLGRGGMVGMGRRASMRENKSFGLKEVMSSYMKKCQHLNECGCQMKSPFNAPEDEPQGYMLVQNLEKIAKKAGELTGVAKYTDDAEPWVESKINSAAEHIDAVYDYIKYGRNKKSDMHGEMDHHEDYEEQY